MRDVSIHDFAERLKDSGAGNGTRTRAPLFTNLLSDGLEQQLGILAAMFREGSRSSLSSARLETKVRCTIAALK